jgi:hypothetical protein
MDRTVLLKRLDLATDKAASLTVESGFVVNKKSIVIGKVSIQKNLKGFYDIYNNDGKMIFQDITVFDVAIMLAQKYNTSDIGNIKKILFLERKFSKYHVDMTFYLNCMKSVKKRKDYSRMAILEDKFQTAEMFAKDTRDKISFFKRSK